MSDELRSMFALGLTREILGQVQEERVRQIEKEGWTLDHDDGHTKGELASAAATYALSGSCNHGQPYMASRAWPWDWKWFKPKSRRQDLIRAAALIVAEIERLDRIERAAKDDPFPPPHSIEEWNM